MPPWAARLLSKLNYGNTNYMSSASKKETPKKKRGRPATGRDPTWTVRLPKQLVAKIDAKAKKAKTTRAQLMRSWIERAVLSD